MPRLSKIGAAALAAFGWTGLSTVSASYLVVAGGGSGGVYYGGGGGAGGILTGTTALNPTESYTVVVGAGAAAAVVTASGLAGNNGSNSQFGILTAAVGGGAGGYVNVDAATTGGSGGGAGGSSITVFTAKAGTAGQGNAGGTNGTISSPFPTGGGGGAGAVGSNGAGSQSGAGGAGTASSISGTSVTYAGGGGGGGTPPGSAAGAGGSGGGGAGSTGSANATAGTANTGGGGGGASSNAVGTASGQGGSGVVIISYPSPQKFGGGVVTVSGANTIHTFTTSGTLSPLSTLTASYLIVAGGAGGAADGGGGGGAGGLLSGSGVTIDSNSNYLVTVGAGGAGGVYPSVSAAVAGGNSSFSMVTTTAVGGGIGSQTSGGNGGSGGGGRGNSTNPGGTGTAGQGNNGGSGSSGNASGAGGGAGAVGANGSATGGAGGIGVTSSISGVSTYYAGGGGGGNPGLGTGLGGAGGLGGGGSGNSEPGGSGTANTGGGGGGETGSATGTRAGGAGGAGVVIISYAGSTQLMAGGTVTISGGNVIHTFNSSGYLTPLTLVGNSLRFRSSASAYLNRTPTVSGNRRTWTFSTWIKRGTLGTFAGVFGVGVTSNGGFASVFNCIRFTDANVLSIFEYDINTATTFYRLDTTQVFRDPAAWYHIVFAFDSTQATASNRWKLYVNGTEVTAFSSTTYPSQNYDTLINTAAKQNDIGVVTNVYLDGYLTEVQLIDGQALTPNSFGTSNQFGVWQPIRYGGSYGTNGFYLPFNAGTSTFAGSFNGSSQYLSVAQNAAFNLAGGDWTAECWFNWDGSTANYRTLFAKRTGGTASYQAYLNVTTGVIFFYNGTTNTSSGVTPVANTWNHLACVQNGANVIVYLNGVSILTVANTTTDITSPFYIGWSSSGTEIFSGFISNFRLVKGTAVYTSNFTLPTANLTAISGTSLLTLQNATIIDNSTNAFTITNTGTVVTALTYPFSAAKIFNDQSPQGNNWTPNNISGASGSTLDYMTDVPTLTSTTTANYAVFNPVNVSGGGTTTITDGNLAASAGSTTTFAKILGSIGMSSGKWYWEVTVTAIGSLAVVGIGDGTPPNGSTSLGGVAGEVSYLSNGNKYTNAVSSAYGSSYTTNDVIGVAYDADAGSITFYKNNTSQGAITGFSGTKFAAVSSAGGTNPQYAINFGQRPLAYTAPSGFLPLNTFNL